MSLIKKIKKKFTKEIPKTTSSVFRGKIVDVHNQYNALLKQDVEIISTSLSKDYTRYGYNETFVLIVTYQKLK